MVPLVPENNIFGEPRPATVPSWFLATSNIATTKYHGADWYTTNVTRFRWLFSSKEKTGTFWNRRWWCEKRHKPNNHSNRLKCQVEMNEIPWTNNPVQKSPRKVFTFRVGLLTSFKLYKEPWTNCVRSDFLRLIKSNHADHWMPAAGEKNWRFFIQKHDFQQQKLLTNVKKPLKCSPSAKLKNPPNFRNYPKNRLKIPLSQKTS